MQIYLIYFYKIKIKSNEKSKVIRVFLLILKLNIL